METRLRLGISTGDFVTLDQRGIDMKKEELDTLKEEAETGNRKLAELSDEELTQVSGGWEGSVDFQTPLIQTPDIQILPDNPNPNAGASNPDRIVWL